MSRDYSYSFSAYSRDEDDDAPIFVDELPQWKTNGTGLQNGENFYEAVKQTIREAIDNHDLDREIEAGGQEIPERYINHYTHLDCPNAVDGDSPEWTDRSPFTNNDKCECGAEIEPWKSDDIEPSDEPEIADRDKTVTLSVMDIATILAALRHYQESGFGDSDNRPEHIWEISVNGDGGKYTSYGDEDIDDLCERINLSGEVKDAT